MPFAKVPLQFFNTCLPFQMLKGLLLGVAVAWSCLQLWLQSYVIIHKLLSKTTESTTVVNKTTMFWPSHVVSLSLYLGSSQQKCFLGADCSGSPDELPIFSVDCASRLDNCPGDDYIMSQGNLWSWRSILWTRDIPWHWREPLWSQLEPKINSLCCSADSSLFCVYFSCLSATFLQHSKAPIHFPPLMQLSVAKGPCIVVVPCLLVLGMVTIRTQSVLSWSWHEGQCRVSCDFSCSLFAWLL